MTSELFIGEDGKMAKKQSAQDEDREAKAYDALLKYLTASPQLGQKISVMATKPPQWGQRAASDGMDVKPTFSTSGNLVTSPSAELPSLGADASGKPQFTQKAYVLSLTA